jgi:5-methylthioadenosine/S-adenosylhomocysteine deaminase
MAKQTVDLVLFARHVIPVEPRDVVLHDTAIVVDKTRIVGLLPIADAQRRFVGREQRQLDRHIVLPGLVNLHTHAPMTLFRGLVDDKALHDWLAEDIWPVEKEFVSAAFVRDGMTHAVAEMIRSGTTCFNNMYFFPDEICRVLESTGMRGAVGQGIMDSASPYGSGPEDFLAKAEPNLKRYAPGNHDLITATMAPHSPYTVGEQTLLKVDALTNKYAARIHIHLHETEAECNDSEQLNRASMCCHKSDQKLRPLANFKRLGLLSDRLVCAHMTHLTDEEIDDVARAGAHVVHCPSSNLKLASGIARVTDMLRRGVNVALGTDGAASNNSLDMLGELKLAALLAKAESRQSTSLSAAEALQMATLNGARALGLEHEIGSIEVGKRADLVAIECDSVEMLPMYNAVSHVVYVAGREHVSDVWINGKQVLHDRQLTTVDEAQVKRNVRGWSERIRRYHNEQANASQDGFDH